MNSFLITKFLEFLKWTPPKESGKTCEQLFDLAPLRRVGLPAPEYPLDSVRSVKMWKYKDVCIGSFDVVTNGAIPCGWASVTREASLSSRLSHPAYPINHHQYLLFLFDLSHTSLTIMITMFFEYCPTQPHPINRHQYPTIIFFFFTSLIRLPLIIGFTAPPLSTNFE